MEFDKSRVYTALNADELKVGSKVLVAYDVADLMKQVGDISSVQTLKHTLLDIHSNAYIDRFQTDYGCTYPLAYLISAPEEKRLKWTDLKVKDVIKRGKEQAEVTYINEEGFAENKNWHIGISCYGLIDDKELEQWEKVEE